MDWITVGYQIGLRPNIAGEKIRFFDDDISNAALALYQWSLGSHLNFHQWCSFGSIEEQKKESNQIVIACV